MNLWLLGLLLCVAWLICLGWQWRENNRLEAALSELPLYLRPSLKRVLVERSTLILMALGGFFFLCGLIAFAWPLAPTLLAQGPGEMEIGAPLPSPPPVPEEPAIPDMAAVVSPENLAAVSPAAGKAPERTSTQPAGPSAVTVGSIFSNEDVVVDSPQQALLDDLKQRYETLFVNYLMLSACQRTDQVAYHVLSAALLRELASFGGASRMHHDILTAARGSYEEIYKSIPCSRPELDRQARQFQDYIDEVKRQAVLP